MTDTKDIQMTETWYRDHLKILQDNRNEEDLKKNLLLEEEKNKERINKIEQDLLGLSDLMTSIRELVQEQQPGIDKVEERVESAHVHTENGVDQLETAELYQKKTRMKKIKVVSGAIVGGLLFGGVGVATFGASQALLAAGIGSGAGAFTGFLA